MRRTWFTYRREWQLDSGDSKTVLVSSAPYVDQPRTPERGEMNKAEKSLNILPKSMRWAPELLAAHSEFCAEIRQRIGDADQHARVPSGSLHPSDDFEKSGSYWSNFRSVNVDLAVRGAPLCMGGAKSQRNSAVTPL